MKYRYRILIWFYLLICSAVLGLSKEMPESFAAAATPAVAVQGLVTTAHREKLLESMPEVGVFGNEKGRRGQVIVVDDRQHFQEMLGFGFALTGGSAEHLMRMSPDARKPLLQELFGREGEAGGIGISYLRFSLGASDLNRFVFSYNDNPEAGVDLAQDQFGLSQDLNDVIPIALEILEVSPAIEIMASPWSAPAWMKDNGEVRGGHLKPQFYRSYAVYLAKYIEAMQGFGIGIEALTIQNEPLNCRNTPSMQWYLGEQKEFLRDHLKPVFESRGIRSKVVLFDHNLDRPDYPLALLADPEISAFAAGSGFHHYGGDMSAMSQVHLARPDKDIYFTEQMITEKPASPDIDIASKVERMIIHTTRNWTRNVILWNLAADPLNDPHTDNGGCSMCQGAITIDGDTVTRNIAYYTIAHASKWVLPGSMRIASTAPGDPVVVLTQDEENEGLIRSTLIPHVDVLPNVAFLTPEGDIVLIVSNTSYQKTGFEIQYGGQFLQIDLPPGAVGTYRWKSSSRN